MISDFFLIKADCGFVFLLLKPLLLRRLRSSSLMVFLVDIKK